MNESPSSKFISRGSATNNVSRCLLFGKNQPENGVLATPKLFSQVREWLKESLEIKTEFQITNREQNKILIEVLSGRPIEITPISENMVLLIDNMGVERTLIHEKLYAFLRQL